MKKFFCCFLVVIIVFLNSFSVIAETAIFSDELEFDNSSVIVILKHEYSIVGKTYSVDYFNCDLIDSVEDLTPVTLETIDDSKYDFDVWKKMFKLYLKESSDKNVDLAIAELSKNEKIEAVDKNYKYDIELEESIDVEIADSIVSYATTNSVLGYITTNDQYRNVNSYGIENSMINKAWGITTGSSDVKVGIIDTGYSSHEDLDDNFSTVQKANFTDESGFEDNVDHGSHVAGIIGACGNNGIGIAGVCWDVTLVNLKAYQKYITSSGNILGRTYYDWVAKAINSAADFGVDVINISGAAHNTEYLDDLETAIDNYNGIIVAAAGNNASSNIYYPAGYNSDKIISVAAVDSSNNLCSFSNYNAQMVDLGAPGYTIFSTIPTDDYVAQSGTSMAAPYVTGAIALLLSINPNLTVSQIRSLILDNVDYNENLVGKVSTSGTLNVFSAVLDAKGYIVGDVDLDGLFTDSDVNMLMSYASQLTTPNNTQRVLADVNYDNYITAADARLIAQLVST